MTKHKYDLKKIKHFARKENFTLLTQKGQVSPTGMGTKQSLQ